MSNDMIYWLIIGAGFVLAAGIALAVMKRTGKLGPAFGISFLVNCIIFVAGSFWWNGLYMGVQRMFGLFGFWIAFVNIEILVFFALFIIKKKQS